MFPGDPVATATADTHEWQCDCCGVWVPVGDHCPHGTTEAMYDEVGRAMLRYRPRGRYTVADVIGALR